MAEIPTHSFDLITQLYASKSFADKVSNHCVVVQMFKENPDSQNPEFSTKMGIYEENCGLDKVVMSWGHDEYMYQVP